VTLRWFQQKARNGFPMRAFVFLGSPYLRQSNPLGHCIMSLLGRNDEQASDAGKQFEWWANCD
jgi:hypothetical protein